MVLISDSLSAGLTHRVRPRRRPARGPGPGPGPGAAGGRSAGSPGLAVTFPAAARPARVRALCSPARLGRLPGPACLQLWARLSPLAPFSFLFKGGAAPQPAVPSARVPSLPVCVVPGILTSGGPSWGQKGATRPLRAAPLRPPARRLAAESPLPQERLRFPAPRPLSRLINIGDGSAGGEAAPRALPLPARLAAGGVPLHLAAGPPPHPKFPLQGSRAGHPSTCPDSAGRSPSGPPAQPSAHSLGPAVGSSGSLGAVLSQVGSRSGPDLGLLLMAGLCLVLPSYLLERVFLRFLQAPTSRPFPSAHPQLSKARPSSPPAAQPEPVLRPSPSTKERLPSLGRACPPPCSCVPDTRRLSLHSLDAAFQLCAHGSLCQDSLSLHHPP